MNPISQHPQRTHHTLFAVALVGVLSFQMAPGSLRGMPATQARSERDISRVTAAVSDFSIKLEADTTRIANGDVVTLTLTLNYTPSVSPAADGFTLTVASTAFKDPQAIQCLPTLDTQCVQLVSDTISTPAGTPFQVLHAQSVLWHVSATATNRQHQQKFRIRIEHQTDGDELLFNARAIRDADLLEKPSNDVRLAVHADLQGQGQAETTQLPIWSPNNDFGGTFSQDWADFDQDGWLDAAFGTLQGTLVFQNKGGRLDRTPFWTNRTERHRAYGVKWADVIPGGFLELIETGSEASVNGGGNSYVYEYKKGQGVFLQKATLQSPSALARVVAANKSDQKVGLIANSVMLTDTNLYIYKDPGANSNTASFAITLPNSTVGLGYIAYNNTQQLLVGYLTGTVQALTISNLFSGAMNGSVMIDPEPATAAYDFAAADYTGDGLPDFAAAFPLQREVRVYKGNLNNGVLGFSKAVVINLPSFFSPLALDWNDVDGDGRMDLIAATQPPLAYHFINDSQYERIPGFHPDNPRGQVWSLRAVRTAYADDLDIVAANALRPSVAYRAVVPRFGSAPSTQTNASGPVALADVRFNNQVRHTLNLIVGSNAFPIQVSEANIITLDDNANSLFNPSASAVNTVQLGDLNFDGQLEIAFGTAFTRALQLAPFADNGSPIWSSALGSGNGVAALGDADGDGRLDIAEGASGKPIAVYLNSLKPASPLLSTPISVSADAPGARALAWGDFDGDRYLDLAVITDSGLRLYRNNSNLTFSLAYSIPLATTPSGAALAWADVNNDGRYELAYGGSNSPAKLLSYTPAPQITQTGSFTTTPIQDSPISLTSLAWGDWNNDGFPELAIGGGTREGINQLHVLANINTPARAASNAPVQLVWLWAYIPTSPIKLNGLAWGDANGDGYLDLAYSDNDSAGIFINTSTTNAPQALPKLRLIRPGSVDEAGPNSSSEWLGIPTQVISQPTISVGYVPATATIFSMAYSESGGGAWKPANRFSAATASSPFVWQPRETDSKAAISQDARLRTTSLVRQAFGPVDRAAISAISPPFQVLGISCAWPIVAQITAPTVATSTLDATFVGKVTRTIGGSGSLTYTWQFGDELTVNGYSQTVRLKREGLVPITLTVQPDACPASRATVATAQKFFTQAPKKSVAASASVPDPPNVLPPVGSVWGEVDGAQTTLRLHWSPPPMATSLYGFRVYRQSYAEDAPQLAAELQPDHTTWHEPLRCGQTYFVTLFVAQDKKEVTIESPPSTNSFVTPACEDSAYTASVAEAVQSAASVRHNTAVPTPNVPTLKLPFTDLQESANVTHSLFLPVAAKFGQFTFSRDVFQTSCVATQIVTPTLPTNLKSCAVYPKVEKGDGLLVSPFGNNNGSFIAFVSNRKDLMPNSTISNLDKNVELFSVKADTCETVTSSSIITKQVTNSTGNIFGGYNLAPSVDYTGTRIAFFSDRNFRNITGVVCDSCDNPDNNFEVFVADVDAGDTITLTQVTSTTGGANTYPAISADGNFVAFLSDAYGLQCERDCSESGGRQNIYRADLSAVANNAPITISQVTSPSARSNVNYDFPIISNGGSAIAYVTNRSDVETGRTGDNYEMRLARYDVGQACTQLGWPVHGQHAAQRASASMTQDANIVVFTSPDAKSIISATNNITKPIVTVEQATLSQVSISADGKKLVFVETTTDGNTTSAQLHRFEGASNTPFQPVASNTRLVILPNGEGVISTTQNGFEVLDLSNLIAVTGTNVSTPAVAGASFVQVFTITHVGALATRELKYAVSNTSSGNTASCNSVSLQAGLTDPGATIAITCTITSNEDAPAGTISTTLTVTPTELDNTPADNTVTVPIQLIRQADLTATLSADPSSAVAGGDVTYSLLIKNNGLSSAMPVTATLLLTNGIMSTQTQSVGCTSAMTSQNLRMICRTDRLPTGDSNTHHFTVTVHVGAESSGTIAASAEIISPESSKVMAQPITTNISQDIVLTAGLEAQTEAIAGKPLNYTLRITNTGKSSPGTVKATVALPPDVKFKSLTGCTPNTSSPSLSCVWSSTQISKSQAVSAVLQVTLPSGLIVQSFNIVVTPIQSSGATLSQTFTTTVSQQADLELSIAARPTPTVQAGGALSYTLFITNHGPSDAQNVLVTDTLPVGIDCLKDTEISTGTCTNGVITWAFDKLPADPPNHKILQFTITVPSTSPPATLKNTATVASQTSDPGSKSNSQEITTTVAITPVTSVKIERIDENGKVLSAPYQIDSGSPITFRATVAPTDATQPISLTWSANGNPASKDEDQTAHTIKLTWTTTTTSTNTVNVLAAAHNQASPIAATAVDVKIVP